MKRRKSLAFLGSVAISLLLPKRQMLLAKEPTVPSSKAQLNVELLKQLLDRKDVAGAVQLVESSWKQQYEEYYQGQLSQALVSTSGISQRLQALFRLTGKRSALLYVIPTPNHLELILVPPGAAPVHRRVLAAKRDVLQKAVKSFRDSVMDPDSDRSTYVSNAQRLYQLMVLPMEQEIEKQRIHTLVFCMGGGLRSTPLAALHDGDRFLIERYNLAIIPAFNLLNFRPVSFKGAKVLAMGASEFEEQDPLPAVPIELNTIAKDLWPGDVLLNQNFTLANFRTYRRRQPYRIVHLATHADFSPGRMLDSYIQFWDRRLSLNQVQELELRSPEVQLLVLSACRTAVGNPQAELGFAGLAVMSGSRSAIASLWQVSDMGTLVLMTEFYRQLRSMNKTEALRQAQVALLSQRISAKNSVALSNRSNTLPASLRKNQNMDLSHPYYWAAFTVIGNAW